MGKQAPIPKYIVKKVPKRKTDIATGRLKGFENLFTFSINGKIISPRGINVCIAIPSNLIGTTLSI